MSVMQVELVEKAGEEGYCLVVSDQVKGEVFTTMFRGINVGLEGKIVLMNESDFAGETIIRDEQLQSSLLKYFREKDPENILE